MASSIYGQHYQHKQSDVVTHPNSATSTASAGIISTSAEMEANSPLDGSFSPRPAPPPPPPGNHRDPTRTVDVADTPIASTQSGHYQQHQQQLQQQQYHPSMYTVDPLHSPSSTSSSPVSVLPTPRANTNSSQADYLPAKFGQAHSPLHSIHTKREPKSRTIPDTPRSFDFAQKPSSPLPLADGTNTSGHYSEKESGQTGRFHVNFSNVQQDALPMSEPRQLQEGYKTPPSMSRTSSGWGTTRLTSHSAHPYGTLSGAASKSDTALQFAEGDYANSRFARMWLAILSTNIVIRWFVFITPVLLLLWIPGVVGVTVDPSPTVWGVKLLNWSIWLSIVWLGWWAGMLVAGLCPHVLRHTVGVIAPELRHYIDYTFALKKSLAAFLWSLANWIAFQPLIQVQGPLDHSTGSGLTLAQFTKALFAIWLCFIILIVEKFLIQIVAYNFHRTSYSDRISDNKFAVRSLVTLYLNSRDIGRSDTLDGARIGNSGKEKVDPTKIIKKALKSTKRVVTGTTTALGTVASEIIGERVLQSNSPQSMVTSALSSANKSRQLARRIFFSFTPHNRNFLHLQDIAAYFPSDEKIRQVFAIFDKDDNGDVSLEEIEMACLEVHRERLSLSSSMRDLDSAVGRLDQILMTLYYIVCILLFVGLLSVSFSGFLTSASAFILGLSWLIGSTSQEVLASIVFLLAKHPYDVGDLVAIEGYDAAYVVKEICLLSTVFKKTDGNITQIPHTVLNSKAIQNYRRSGPTSEAFTWEVDFSTTFEQIESLRETMMEFLENEKRDFLPRCDISVTDLPAQGNMTLSTAIPYKGNWSNSALKTQRRNKWICALKIAMAQLSIFGPSGAGNPSPDPAQPQMIKLLNPEAAAPPYRSLQSPAPESSPVHADASHSQTHRPSSLEQIQQRPSSHNQSAIRTGGGIAAEVNRIGLTNHAHVLQDTGTDIFDYQGDANREDGLDLSQAALAAEVQLSQGRANAFAESTLPVTRMETQCLRDLELGQLSSNLQVKSQ